MLTVLIIIIATLLAAPLISALKAGLALFFERSQMAAETTGQQVPERNEVEACLAKFSYYQKLSIAGKDRFLQRILNFIATKNFSGMAGLGLTNEMRITVSALAVQISFGLTNYSFTFFHTICIYPATFYSKLVGARLKGGTSNSGFIQLSWPDLVSGIEVEDDKINLGLHELAHALEINILKGSDFDVKFASYFEYWQEQADSEYSRMKAGEKSFLRAYGGTNTHEFFAVCVEHFFEAPFEFSQKLPRIYHNLVTLLNQDPLRLRCDYEPDYSIISTDVNENVKVSYRYSPWHWSLTVLLCGIFVGPFLLFYQAGQITNPGFSIFGLYTVMVILGCYPQYKYLVGREILNGVQFVGYLFLGFGILACSCMLFLNSIIAVSERTEMYKIRRVIRTTDSDSRIVVENDPFGDNKAITLVRGWQPGIQPGNYLEITFQKGFLGGELFKENRIIRIKPSEEDGIPIPIY
jgi:Mlc titration factor MtfA (ptsG expression regulator)